MKVNHSGVLELMVWLLALIGLYAFGGASAHTFSLCPLDNFGLTWCPGCGIGRSMHYFMMGDFSNSLTYHPLGWFGVSVILFRIYELIKLKIKLWQMY
ncbi:DUF2752 domain-containing protein [Cyclobacterium amurskyense]|uniref:DUF2752 domain-containing protein n=1 Tax=Cyclobacterium amurskyense TaxID=320787 RepID=A0A0H4PCM0_9BACT|nr:DUF2752 domain-containing protein [Cyclobacterium amurskyense]AKP52201.1 hypothetical protein CA2015_2791 [Cyclobacterium amurskyense]|tara:strand:- start:26614 stop:26907 length:294 start_codon:yes stop_codon:yes gene_type:complete